LPFLNDILAFLQHKNGYIALHKTGNMKWIRVFLLLLLPGGFALGQASKGADTSASGGAHPADANAVHPATTGAVDGLHPAASAAQWSILQKDNFSIRYPSAWTPNTEGSGMVNFFILAPLASPDAKFRENVNLVIEDLGQDSAMSLNELATASLDALKSAFAEFELESSHQLSNARGPYQRFIYKSVQNGYPLQFIQEFQIIKKRAYILTFTAEQSKFEADQELGERILQSFAFSK